MNAMSNMDIQTIITDPNGAKTLVTIADQLGKQFKETGLSTNQIRTLFGEVRQIEAQWSMGGENSQKALRRLILLKPKMAYRARKERGKAIQDLVAVLDDALDQVIKDNDIAKQEQNFKRFVEFFEAILAYHKSHGGN